MCELSAYFRNHEQVSFLFVVNMYMSQRGTCTDTHRFKLPYLTSTEVFRPNGRIVKVVIVSVTTRKIRHRKYDSKRNYKSAK